MVRAHARRLGVRTGVRGGSVTVVNHETGEIVETIGVDEARRLTTEAQNEFRSGAAHTARAWELVEEAVMGGGHIDLGYRSPGDYLQAEFDGVLAGFNIAERRLAVRTMTGWGLSVRAIAKAADVSVGTVHADQVFSSEHLPATPEPADDREAGTGSGAVAEEEVRGTTERDASEVPGAGAAQPARLGRDHAPEYREPRGSRLVHQGVERLPRR